MQFNKVVGEINRFLERKTSYLFFVGVSNNAQEALLSHGVDLSDMRQFRVVVCDSEDTALRVHRYFRDNFQLQGQEIEPRDGHTQVYIFQITHETSPSL